MLLFGALLPAAARASVFGDLLAILSGTAEAKAEPAEPTANLQTLELPTPANNVDPTSGREAGDITIVNGSALMPEEGPSGTMADIEKPRNSTVSTYIVREGDTVQSVAKMHNISDGTILSANDLPRGAKLKAGQELIILPVAEVKYTVQKGDTLQSIAKRYGGDVNEIALRNSVDNSTLAAGAVIYIPNGEIPATPAPTAKKKAIASTSGAKTTAPGKNSGYYVSPVSGYIRTQGVHGYNAVDLAASSGTSIRASASGSVTVARSSGWNGGYGAYVVISHGNGSQTLYAHMSKVAVASGEQVAQGEVIGYVGSSGLATGPHLHFEIRNGIRNPF